MQVYIGTGVLAATRKLSTDTAAMALSHRNSV